MTRWSELIRIRGPYYKSDHSIKSFLFFSFLEQSLRKKIHGNPCTTCSVILLTHGRAYRQANHRQRINFPRQKKITRSSTDADKRARDAFRGQSRSPNLVPFHMLRTVSYWCLPRDAMRERGLWCLPVSRCPSVCLSRSCIVSRWLKISSNFFPGPLVSPIVLFFDAE